MFTSFFYSILYAYIVFVSSKQAGILLYFYDLYLILSMRNPQSEIFLSLLWLMFFLFIFRVFSSVYRLHMFHPAARILKYSENGSEMCFSLKKHPTSARFYIKCKMCSAYSFSVMWCLHFELKV